MTDFGTPSVPWGSKIVAATNDVVILTANSWNTPATVLALNRYNGRSVWNFTINEAGGSTGYCQMVGVHLFCANSTALIRLDPASGAPIGSPAEGNFYLSTPYAPAIGATTTNPDQLQMVYYSHVASVNDIVSLGSIVGANLSISPTPTSPMIVIERFTGPNCQLGTTTTQKYTPGCSAAGAVTSTLRFCATNGAGVRELRLQYFTNSSSCGGLPAATDAFALNSCVDAPDGESWMLLACPTK